MNSVANDKKHDLYFVTQFSIFVTQKMDDETEVGEKEMRIKQWKVIFVYHFIIHETCVLKMLS